jgi:hypothetical protein
VPDPDEKGDEAKTAIGEGEIGWLAPRSDDKELGTRSASYKLRMLSTDWLTSGLRNSETHALEAYAIIWPHH